MLKEEKMKRNKILLGLMFLLIVSMAINTVSARKGVGIVWDTELETINEMSTHCISYGIYNPFDEDVTAKLEMSEAFDDIVSNAQSDPQFVAAGTGHDAAVDSTICFDVADVYEENCWIGGMMCEQACTDEDVSYDGTVVVAEVQEDTGDDEGTGSSTSLGASVPLKLQVACSPKLRDWTLVYVVVVAIAVIVVGLILLTTLKKHKAQQEFMKEEGI